MHHESDKVNNHAIIVNSQTSPNYPNKQICGAGMVYKVCKCLDDILEVSFADDYLDLVAVGNVGDMQDMRVLETRYLTLKGLENINNPFLKALIKKQSYSMNGEVTINGIGFYISPLINATIRVGTEEEKNNMFNAFIENNSRTLPYKKRGTTEEIQQPIAEAMARICGNVKARQNRQRDKGVKILQERIKEKQLDTNKVLIVNGTGVLDKAFSGLVANQLKEQYGKPVIILQQKENQPHIFGGSVRSVEKGDDRLTNFKDFLNNTGLFNFASGHQRAFGYAIPKKNIVPLSHKLNELLQDCDLDPVYNVDFMLDVNNLSKSFIDEVYELRNIWSRGVEESLVLVKDFTIHKENIHLMGKTAKKTIKFVHNGISFIKFGCTEEEYDDLVKHGTITVDLVGKCGMNEYQGRKYPQVILEDFVVTSTTKEVEDFYGI